MINHTLIGAIYSLTYWITKAPLSDQREENIASCFQKYVDFNYLQTLDEFNMELDFF